MAGNSGLVDGETISITFFAQTNLEYDILATPLVTNDAVYTIVVSDIATGAGSSNITVDLSTTGMDTRVFHIIGRDID